MAGSLVALALNLPLSDIDSLAQGRSFSAGNTRSNLKHGRGKKRFQHALIVDDSSRTGAAMEAARAKLKSLDIDRITYCVIFGVHDQHPSVDLALSIVPTPRIFEWNVFHHPILSDACVDIDGVLCHDPTPEQNDDGDAYLNFLTSALPFHRPTHRIGALVTSRLEKYRPQTVSWLEKWGVKYDQLIMLNLPDAETRRSQGAHGSFKGKYYRKSNFSLFIESEQWQAIDIANISGKPVLWIEAPQIVYPGSIRYDPKVETWARSGLKGVAHNIIGAKNWERFRRIIGRT